MRSSFILVLLALSSTALLGACSGTDAGNDGSSDPTGEGGGAAQQGTGPAGDASAQPGSDGGASNPVADASGANGTKDAASGADAGSPGDAGGSGDAMLDAGGDHTPPTVSAGTSSVDGPGAWVEYFAAGDNVGLASYELWQDGALVKTVAAKGVTFASSTFSYSVSAGQDGTTLHFEVRATDTSGNTTAMPFDVPVTFDKTPPVLSTFKSSVTTVGPLPTDVTISVDAVDKSSFTLELYKGATLVKSTPFPINVTLPLGYSDNGTAAFYARAIDRWGNASAMMELDVAVAVSQSWIAPYGTPQPDAIDQQIALDPSGNMFVAGTTFNGALGGPAAGDEDAVLQKRDASGAVLWTKQLGTAGVEHTTSLSVTGSRAYLGGTSTGALLGPAGHIGAGFLIAYDTTTAAVLWQKWYTDPVKTGFVGSTVASPDNDVWVIAGTTTTSLTRFDSAGNALWSVSGFPLGPMAVDASKNVYVVSNSNPACQPLVGGGLGDGCITKLDASGNKVWQISFGTAENELPRSVSMDAAGNLYTMGTTNQLAPWVRSFDAAGKLRYFTNLAPLFANWTTGVASASGEFWVAGANRSSDHPNSQTLTKLDTAGNVAWSKAFGGVAAPYPDASSMVAVDASSNAYFIVSDLGGMFGPGLGSTDAAIVSFTSAGALR